MLKYLSGLTFLLLVLSWPVSAESSEPASFAPHRDRFQHFEAYLDGLMAAQFANHKLAGATFSLIHNNRPVLTKGYGMADLKTGTAVDPDRHLFRPGSVSKLFTWTAVMQLVEQGKLDLSADAGTYVSQFKLPNRYGIPLTLTHLLTHTPGLEDGAAGYLMGDEPSDNIGLAQALEKWMPSQVREPGTLTAYSNWGTALAGLIVANVSGVSFEQYVQDNIFTPLKMTQASFEEPLPGALGYDMATGYVVANGANTPFGFEFIKNFGPAGALSASAGAITNFMMAHLNEGRFGNVTILQPDTVRLMHSRLHSHDDRVPGFAHGFYETVHNNQRFIGHAGSTISFHSELLLDTTNRFGLFVSFNSSEGALARQPIVEGVLDYFYPKTPINIPAEPPKGSAERISALAGAYRLTRRSYSKLEAIQSLAGDIAILPLAQQGSIHIPNGRLRSQFTEIEPWVFQQVDKQQQLIFKTDAEGNVTQALISGLPMMALEKVRFLEQASTHQSVILIALLAALFTLINAIRNRHQPVTGAALWGKRSITLAATAFLGFVITLAVALSGLDMNRVIVDFPPPGTPVALTLAILGAACTALSALLLIPVWRAEACKGGARWRYLWLILIFAALSSALYYWNLLGWNY